MTRRNFHRAPGAERRHDLIEATLDCIAEAGLQGATVRRIAIKAGVTSGLIRHYFDSKEMILQEAYRVVIARLTEKAKAVTGTPEERLRSFILINLTEPVANSQGLSLWASFISRVGVDPALAAIHREGYLSFRHTLEDLLAEFLAARGEAAAPARCRALAIAVNGILDGLWLEGCLAGELFEDSELVSIAFSSIEALIGHPIGAPAATEQDREGSDALRLHHR
ncbi:TetR family transcriptional regulator C-terminal domain-containing protein [Ancylobacter sonchi]|uniref:TetR family transcriptional regulator C-terminal domain-containing protein n=1 Tax=Ancylobacter sonchi TaxID=1937790 RepID=UPI001BD29F39|nr:TetR family transcriptional regulator C-terminal domain-containing protein [Ancylobacter sonchi]MBS7534632.1 TetR family transcriptional regulator C-terminal domain-containing protein [Ancylobacter sonchi]